MSISEARTKPSLVRYALLGALGGVVGGAVFIGVTMWFSATQGNPAVAPFNLISSIVLGADSLMAGTASVPLGIAVHAVNSLIFGAIFGLVAARLPRDATIAVAALVYGLLLYLVNFQLIGRFVLPQFQMPNQPFEVFAHLVFAAVVAPFVFRWGRSTVHKA